MSEAPRSSEQYAAGQAINWHSGAAGDPVKGTVVRASKTGKRIQIEYEVHLSWTGGRPLTERTYVKPTSLSRRHD